jgi:hypothetical protein
LLWLTGTWQGQSKEGELDQTWSLPSGRTMTGMGRVVIEGRTRFFEFMTIEERGDSVVLTAWPRAEAPMEFKLKELRGEEVEFVNPEREFPNRIVYTHEADGLLHARAEGRVKGEAKVEQYWLKKAE